ncbi:MAG: hypothetical protein ACOZCO_13670 [Bacteroidota bacterium]
MIYLKKYRLLITGLAIGAIAGYLYYHFVGCENGSCSIKSNPVYSTIYGSIFGGLIFNLFTKEKKEEK